MPPSRPLSVPHLLSLCTSQQIWNHPDSFYYTIMKSSKDALGEKCEDASDDRGITKWELLKRWPLKIKDPEEYKWAANMMGDGQYKSGFLRNSYKFDILMRVRFVSMAMVFLPACLPLGAPLRSSLLALFMSCSRAPFLPARSLWQRPWKRKTRCSFSRRASPPWIFWSSL